MASGTLKMNQTFMKTLFNYLILVLTLTVYLVLVKLLGLEFVGFMLSPFYGGRSGSFILASLSLGPLGGAIVLFLFLHYFRAYILAVTIGVFARKWLADTKMSKIMTGLLVGITAIVMEYAIANDIATDISSRLLINDALSSLLVAAICILIFYNLKKYQRLT